MAYSAVVLPGPAALESIPLSIEAGVLTACTIMTVQLLPQCMDLHVQRSRKGR